MTPELTYLFYAVILLILHMFVQATFSDLSKGLGWALGAQDEKREPSVFAARLERALRNYVYNLPAYIGLVVILTQADLANESTALGAALWFWARVAYVACYASGIPVIRSIAWFASLAGLAMMAAPLI
ncbi:MAG: MAPEG family protein [Pseudomonadota bacterium]